MKRTVLVGRSSRSRTTWIDIAMDQSMSHQTPAASYVLCIDDGGYPESLEVRKVYQVIADPQAAQQQFLRIIDETGEDYLYPARLFVPIQVPPEAARVLKGQKLADDPVTK